VKHFSEPFYVLFTNSYFPTMSESPTTVTAIEPEMEEPPRVQEEFRMSGLEQHQTLLAMAHSRKAFEAGGPLQFLAPLPGPGTGIFIERSFTEDPHRVFISFPPQEEQPPRESFVNFFECMHMIREFQIGEIAKVAPSNLEVPVSLEIHTFAKQFMEKVEDIDRDDVFHIETTGVENRVGYKGVFLGKKEIIMYECNKESSVCQDILLINKFVDMEKPCLTYHCNAVRRFEIPTDLLLKE